MSNAAVPGHGEIEGSGEPPAGPKETDVAAYAPVSAEDALSGIRVLVAVAGHETPGFADDRLEDLGFVLEGGDPLEDQANWLIDEMPLAIAATTTFEVVLGTGGPDRRLCFECSGGGHGPMAYAGDVSFEVRRVYYRYSWWGSAEVELTGEDRETAEAFGRRVVAELAE
jgi:hypothetical protein